MSKMVSLAMLVCGVGGMIIGMWGGQMIGLTQGRAQVTAEVNEKVRWECSSSDYAKVWLVSATVK